MSDDLSISRSLADLQRLARARLAGSEAIAKVADRYVNQAPPPRLPLMLTDESAAYGDAVEAERKALDRLAALPDVAPEPRLADLGEAPSVVVHAYPMVFGHCTINQLEKARKIVVEVMRAYGDLCGDEYERFLANPWNDHCSVQAALRSMPKAGEPVTDAMKAAGVEALKDMGVFESGSGAIVANVFRAMESAR